MARERVDGVRKRARLLRDEKKKKKAARGGKNTLAGRHTFRRCRAYFHVRFRLRTCFRNNERPFGSSLTLRNMEKGSLSSPRHGAVEQAGLDRGTLAVWCSNCSRLFNRNPLLPTLRHRRAVISILTPPDNRCQRRRNKKEATATHAEKGAGGKVPAALGAEDQAERAPAAASGEERQVKSDRPLVLPSVFPSAGRFRRQRGPTFCLCALTKISP